MEENLNIYGRRYPGGLVTLHDRHDGSAVTRLDANVYSVGSSLSARYEHPEGIVLTLADAQRLKIALTTATPAQVADRIAMGAR